MAPGLVREGKLRRYESCLKLLIDAAQLKQLTKDGRTNKYGCTHIYDVVQDLL